MSGNRPAPDAEDAWRSFLAASKKKKGALYTRYVNRNAAIPLTYIFWKLGLHPNTVSVLGFLVTHAAIALLLTIGASMLAVIGAWFLLALGYVLDSSDGQLARVSGKTSRLGEWLDHTFDIVKIQTVNMTLSYLMIVHAIEAGAPLMFPLTAAFLNLVAQPSHFCSAAVRSLLFPGAAVAEFGAAGGAARLLRSVLSIGDYGVFILLVLLLPWTEVFTILYLFYGLFFAALFLLYIFRSARVMRKLESRAL